MIILFFGFVSSLLFWPELLGVLVTIKSSTTVRCLQWGFATCKTSGILGDNAACMVPGTWVSSGVLGTFFVFGIPSMVWPSVQHKFSAEAMG